MTMLKEGRPTAPTPVEDAHMAPATRSEEHTSELQSH